MRELSLQNIATNEVLTFRLSDEFVAPLRLPPDLRFLILVKDKFRISDEAFKELSQLLKDMPTFYAFSKKIKELDAEVNVIETPGKAGVQVSFKESLSKKIRKSTESDPELHLKPIKVKFSGDGTWLGKRLHLVKEDYSNIEQSLQDIDREMREVFKESLKVDEEVYEVEFFLGGDYKFLLVVCGLGVYCKKCICKKDERGNQTKQWSMFDANKGARSIEKLIQWARAPQKYSCKHKPMFDFIPLDHVVVDLLHLFLRIADVLIAKLIQDLRLLDNITKNSTFPPPDWLSTFFDLFRHFSTADNCRRTVEKGR